MAEHARSTSGWKRLLAVTGGAALTATSLLAVGPGTAFAASGASFTATNNDVDGPGHCTNGAPDPTNCNSYDGKQFAWLNAGPDGAALDDGTYYFAVLSPSGQQDPTDGTAQNLSDGANGDVTTRTFTVSGGVITYLGTHEYDATHNKIRLTPYDDTTNGGGVYVLAVCPTAGTAGSCKYDAFKVASAGGGPSTTDLVAVKTADTSYTTTYSWDVEKSVDRTAVSVSGPGTATFSYTVDVTKSAGVSTAYAVSGTVTVFNTNTFDVNGVSVTDAVAGATCGVTGGSSTVAAGSSEVFSYSCAFAGTPSPASGINEATVTWTAGQTPTASTTAQDGWDFADATVTTLGDSTAVTDAFGPASSTPADVALTPASTSVSRQYTYTRTVDVPATGCQQYDNTARVSGDSDSASVTVCRLVEGGHTIGFWRNRNGQQWITSHGTEACGVLTTYSTVLTAPTGCDGAKAAAYASGAIDAATTTKKGTDAVAMFRAQFLATALSVPWSGVASLGNQYVQLTAAEQAALGLPTSCQSVNAVLAAGNAQFTTLVAGPVATLNLVKDVYDRINNNTQVTC
jgi:hypothetical protein